jgi:hypothetical protein
LVAGAKGIARTGASRFCAVGIAKRIVPVGLRAKWVAAKRISARKLSTQRIHAQRVCAVDVSSRVARRAQCVGAEGISSVESLADGVRAVGLIRAVQVGEVRLGGGVARFRAWGAWFDGLRDQPLARPRAHLPAKPSRAIGGVGVGEVLGEHPRSVGVSIHPRWSSGFWSEPI